MLKILLVEDDLIIAKELRKALQQFNCEVVGIARSVDEAIELFDTLNPNFAFIDIEFEGKKNGIDFAEYINVTCRIPFVFLTDYFKKSDQYFDRVNATQPASFLPKGSFLPNQLWHFVELALDSFAKAGDVLIKEDEVGLFLRDQFFIKNGTLWEKIHSNQITHIVVSRPYCKLLMADRKGDYFVRQSLDYVMKSLSVLPLLRIHQSHAVNINFIHQYDAINNKLILKNDIELEIGKTYKNLLKERLFFLE